MKYCDEKIQLNKQIILYGDLRCCRDFSYIFDKTEIVCSLYGEDRENRIKEYIGQEIIVIICAFDSIKCTKELEALDLKSNLDYTDAKEIFKCLDYPIEEKTDKREVYIWGAGQMADVALEVLEGKKINGFIDRDIEKVGSTYKGIKIYSPETIQEKLKAKFIIVSSIKYYYSVRKELISMGLKENEDFIGLELLLNKPSDWLKKTFYDMSYYDFCCETFFRVFEVETGGNVSCCCTTLINGRIGNLLYEDYDDIWKSIYHKIQCLSLCNRTFSFCIKNACPALIQREKKIISDNLAKDLEYKSFECRPEYLHLSIDETCNLYCESCRDCIVISKGEELEKTTILKEKLLKDADRSIRSFFIAGNGEVFLSKTYEEIWKSEMIENADTIRLLSNGMLFTPKRWNEFYKGKEHAKIWVYISIDAATKETYEEIRRGGNFDTLLKNLRFISELRKNKVIDYFRINFVVQRKNYLEMEKFIELGMSLGVDNVFFTKILNWGTYTDEEFDSISMMQRDMKAPKDELKQVLDKEIFKNKIVDLGTIQYDRNRKLPDYIDNYYEWETRDWIEMNRGK